jgi:hypothetical protein
VFEDLFQRFTYHRISNDEINNMLIPNIYLLVKKISVLFDKDLIDVTIGFSFGKRMITIGKDTKIDKIQRKNFIEIIDVDPVKNTVMYIGPLEPSLFSPLLYMIIYAKTEIQYCILLNLGEERIKNINTPIVSTRIEDKTFLDLLKLILKHLQNQDIVFINNNLLLITSQTKNHINELIEKVGGKIENTR